MQNSVYQNTVKFIGVNNSQLTGIICYSIQTNKNITGYDTSAAVIEGNNIGEIIMLKILFVHLENAGVWAENVGDISHFSPPVSGNHLYPAIDNCLINIRHFDIFGNVMDHEKPPKSPKGGLVDMVKLISFFL